jgi:hypothetical protein
MDEKPYEDHLDHTIKQKTITTLEIGSSTGTERTLYTKLDQYPLAYFSDDKDGKKKSRNLVPDFAALRKVPESLREKHCESLILENKRSISHEMVDDTIEDASEKLSEQVVLG